MCRSLVWRHLQRCPLPCPSDLSYSRGPRAGAIDRGRCLDYTVLQEAFEFKKPIRPASRGCLRREEGSDLFTQRQSSAPARMVCALAHRDVSDGKRTQAPLTWNGRHPAALNVFISILSFETGWSHFLVFYCVWRGDRQSRVRDGLFEVLDLSKDYLTWSVLGRQSAGSWAFSLWQDYMSHVKLALSQCILGAKRC